MRCPKCGHESALEEYICSNCDYRLKSEKIEEIPGISKIFRRVDEKWYNKKERPIKRIYKVITNPSRAFWDIKNQKTTSGDSNVMDFKRALAKDHKGPFLITFLNALIMGLWALAIYIHATIQAYQGVVLTTEYFWVAIVQAIPVFIMFSLFGFFYYSILFWFYDKMFSIAANFSDRYDDTLKIRYNVKKYKKSFVEKVLRANIGIVGRAAVDYGLSKSFEQKGILLKIKQTGKYKIMKYAYAPTILTNLISAIILFAALPSVQITDTAYYANHYLELNEILSPIFASSMWGVVDFLQILTLMIWIPITMSIALRELGNSNTTKLLIGFIVLGVLLSYMIIFLRPTLGWNFDIISAYA